MNSRKVRYSCFLVCLSVLLGSSWTVPAVAAPLPNPSGFTATAGAGGVVILKWSPVKDAIYYNLQGAGVPSVSGMPPNVSGTTYTVKGLPAGTHSWVLFAVYSGPSGPYWGDESKPARTSMTIARPAAQVVPPPPTNIAIPTGTQPLLQGGKIPQTGASPPVTTIPPAAQPNQSRLIKVDGLTRQQFDQLKIQNSDVIEYKGKQYEVGILRSQMQKAEATALATMNQNAPKAQAKFDAYRSNFDKVQLSNLAAANAQVAAQAKILMQQRVQASTGQTTAPSKPIPVIEGTTVEVTPGGKVLIVGSGLAMPDFVRLSIPNKGDFHLEIESFQGLGGWILCTVPAGIDGIPDGPATLAVQVGAGWGGRGGGVVTWSNLWPVKFIATREVILMKGFKGGELVYCDDTSGSYNTCKVGEENKHWTFLGSHYPGDLFQLSGGKGGDVWKASLANGWTFEDVTITVPWDSRGGQTLVVSGFKKSSSSLTLVVEWSFFLYWEGLKLYTSSAFYPMELRIVGPKGIPYY